MCKAHVLRFRCRHGIVMSIEPCRLGPCPVLKTTGQGLPQQPTRCYNCQQKAARSPSSRPEEMARVNSWGSSSSDESLGSRSSTSSISSHTNPFVAAQLRRASMALPSGPMPPSDQHRLSIPTVASPGKNFLFTCHSSDHYATPHYTDLPTFLPHQDHSCPPCQLDSLRTSADSRVEQTARFEYPSLRSEQLVRDGRTWDPEVMTKPSSEQYIQEKRDEERQIWLHVTRKWTQDLAKAGVLVSEEDGLGLSL